MHESEPSMLPLASLSRAWILLAMVAVLAYAACATGAGPCSVFKPVGLVASLSAAALLMFVPDTARDEAPAAEREHAGRR